MKPEKPDIEGRDTHPAKESLIAVSPAILWIQGVFSCVYWTTIRYIRNIPSRIRNKYLRWRNLKNRMPKRKTRSKVYVLIGYTSKEHVDRRYRAIKLQHFIRKVLFALVIIVFLLIFFKWLNPLRNSDQYKQMMGISDMKDLTRADPFGTEGVTANVSIYTPTDTPTNTPTPSAVPLDSTLAEG